MTKESRQQIFDNPFYFDDQVNMSENGFKEASLLTLSEHLEKFERLYNVDNPPANSSKKNRAKKQGLRRLFSLGSAASSQNLKYVVKRGERTEINRSTSLPKTFRSPLTSLNNVGAVRTKFVTHKIPKKDGNFKECARETRESQSNEGRDPMHLYPSPGALNCPLPEKRPPPCPMTRPATTRSAPRLQGFKNRPHVLHKLCKWKEGHFDLKDGVIVFSKECNVAVSWANYFQQFLKVNESIDANLQPVEEFSVLSDELKFGNNKAGLELARIEEETHHSKCQIIIVDEKMLEWVYKNPSLILGKLFNSEVTLCLMLGVEQQDVRTEHKAALLTYSQWKKVKICKGDQFTDQFHSHVRSILREPYLVQTPNVLEGGVTFSLWPEKMTMCNKKALLLLSQPISKSDKVDVTACPLESEIRKSGRRLSAHKIDCSTIEISVSPDDFADLCQNDGGKARVGLFINDKCHLATSGPEKAVLTFESPLESMNELITTTTIVAETMMRFTLPNVSGKGPFNLDKHMASIISRESHQNLFENLQDTRPDVTEKINEKFPTLIHWAAFHGLEKTVITLLTLPGSQDAANIANVDGKVAHELAELSGHADLARLLQTKIQLRKSHRYEYPEMSGATKIMPCYENDPSPLIPAKTINRVSLGSSSSGSTYDTPRSSENWYVVPPSPVPVSTTPPKPDTSYLSMKPRSNSAGSRKEAEKPSGAISKAKSVSTTVIGANPETICGRNERARSFSEEAGEGSFFSSRPLSREELIKTYNNLSGEEVVLKDFQNAEKDDHNVNLEGVGDVERHEKSKTMQTPDRSQKGSTKDLSKAESGGMKLGRNLFKVSKCSTLPSKFHFSKRRSK